MLFASRVLSGGSARDRMKMLGDEMYSSLNRRLTFSTHVQLLAEGSDPAGAQYENVLFVKDGRLYQGRKEGPYSPYTGEDVYSGDGPDHAGRGGQIDDAPHPLVLLSSGSGRRRCMKLLPLSA